MVKSFYTIYISILINKLFIVQNKDDNNHRSSLKSLNIQKHSTITNGSIIRYQLIVTTLNPIYKL